jgi:multicomponent Na+:H+ antiporter subunit E
MFFTIGFFALPLALLFMTLSDQWTWGGFGVGYGVGVVTLILTSEFTEPINWRRLPTQILGLFLYIIWLGWEILLSGFDVARRVLDPRLPIQPGEMLVSTQDAHNDVAISALSAHAITVTPGEMVTDFTHENGQTQMIVHTLDIEATGEKVDNDQTRRLRFLQRITEGK